MTMAAVHASLSHLVAGQDRNKAAISDAIDSVVSAHQHGGKDAFDDRVTDLRAAIDATFLTMDAIHETAQAAADLPLAPKTAAAPAGAVVAGTPSAPALDAANQPAATGRATRAGAPEGK